MSRPPLKYNNNVPTGDVTWACHPNSRGDLLLWETQIDQF